MPLRALACLGLASCAAPQDRVPAVRREPQHRAALSAQIVTLDAPTQEALEHALRQLSAPAVVLVPKGRYAIRKTVEVHTDGVTLRGAGAEVTVFFRADEEGPHLAPLVAVRRAKGVRVTGIGFEGSSDPASKAKDIGVLLEDAADFRVDHASFVHVGFAGVRTTGRSRGVVDHSSFVDAFKPAIGTDGYGVAVYGTDALEEIPFGSDAATFVEDSTFAGCRHAVASNKGGRYVFRHNHVKDGVVAHAVDAHGAEYNSKVGGEWIDVHDNVIEQAHHDKPYYDGWAVRVRGGRALVWNNEIRGYKIGVELTELTEQRSGPVWVWGNRFDPGALPTRTVRAGDAQHDVLEEPPRGYTPYPYPHPLATRD